MTDTQWCDVSQFQAPVDDSYPFRVIAIRSNDGTYQDTKFLQDRAWCIAAVAAGKIDFFFSYVVYEPDNEAWAQTHMNSIGTPHPREVTMVDLESWGGRISGDHSADINAGVGELAQWQGNLARVTGYGNTGDLDRIWPNKALAPNHLIVAAYGTNPSYPGKFAHQYTSTATEPPFGYPVDMNSADGYDIPALMSLLGLDPNVTGGGADPFNPTQEDPMNIVLYLYLPTNSLLLVDHLAKTIRNLGNSATDPVRALYATKPYIKATDTGDTVNIGAGAVDWAATTNGYAYITAPDVAGAPVTATLTDAQVQAVETGVAAALTSAGTPQAQIDAIATAVRAQFASNPLK